MAVTISPYCYIMVLSFDSWNWALWYSGESSSAAFTGNGITIPTDTK